MKKIKKIIFAIAFLSCSFVISPSFAQGPCPPGGCDDEDPSEEIPIDGGVGFLVAAGIGLGAKKLSDRSKRKKSAL
jgi:hypothetical protein